MSIWVISQDKEILVEATNVRVSEESNNGYVYYMINSEIDSSTTFQLGEYSTKKKALEVLYMIQRVITSQLCDISRIVFQMPQDDEV